MTTTRAILPALLAFAILAAPHVGADEAKDQIKAFQDQMKTADEAGKVRLIQEMAASGNAGAGKAISKFMTNRSTAVKVAAIKSIGQLKEKKYYGKLMGMLKPMEKQPKVLTAVLEAVGNYGNKASLKQLTGVAKKWIYKDAEVGAAACRAIGHIPVKGAVEELIKLLAMTNPSSGGQGAQVAPATRDLLAKSKPAIIEGLQTLTNWDFDDAPAWNRFWELEQKRWKPPSDEKIDLTKLKKWLDPGYGFSMDKPSDKWIIDRGPKQKDYRLFMARYEEEVLQCFIRVSAYENTHGMTAKQRADSYAESYRENWDDIRDGSWEERDCKIGKISGFTHSFRGKDSVGNIAFVRNVFAVRGQIMFIVEGWWRSGSPDEVIKEVHAAIDSLKIFD